MAARNWTPEQRARQAAAIQRWRPWDTTKGPKTPEGKAKVGRNAYRGHPRATLKAAHSLARLLADDAAWLASI
jgi:hypothetical protein